ncbi:hypothetical protein D9M71_686370 [compost metagenome]
MPTRSRSAISLISAPAAKALALPVMTTAPMLGSFSTASSSAASSPNSSVFSALSASGRCRVIRRTAWCVCTARVCGMKTVLAGPGNGAGLNSGTAGVAVLLKYTHKAIQNNNTKK